MQQFVQLLVPAHPAAVQERVQRLLLSVLGQAAEPARAWPCVHTARLALFERASHAAPAAGLLHRLAAHRHRRAHGQHLLIAWLARHVGRVAAGDGQQRNQQEGEAHRHGGCGSGVKLRGLEWSGVVTSRWRRVSAKRCGESFLCRWSQSEHQAGASRIHRCLCALTCECQRIRCLRALSLCRPP